MSRITQTDIAKALGLSPTTVGLVVGAVDSPLRKRLNPETIRRVQEMADKMGYIPNRAAQMVRSGKSNLIVFLNSSGSSELGVATVYEIGRRVHEAGYDFQAIDAYWWQGDGKRVLEQIRALRPEGVFVAGSKQSDENLAEALLEAGIKVVSIGYGASGVPMVRPDIGASFRQLTLAAIAQNRKRPSLILRSYSSCWAFEERKKGFYEALQQAGWPEPVVYHYNEALPPPDDENRAQVFMDTTRPLYSTPFMAGTLMAEWIGHHADALICTNDHYACGAATHYLQNGFSIPDEISISGFDNLSFTTQGITPITTAKQPFFEMCEAAMNMLLGWIGGKFPAPAEHVFPCELIWRQSMPSPSPQSTSHPTPTIA